MLWSVPDMFVRVWVQGWEGAGGVAGMMSMELGYWERKWWRDGVRS